MSTVQYINIEGIILILYKYSSYKHGNEKDDQNEFEYTSIQ